MTSLAEIERMAARISEMSPPRISYIVTDPAYLANGAQEEQDREGRRYLLVNSRTMAALPRGKRQIYGFDGGSRLNGIPVIPRENLPDGWGDK